MVRELVGLPVTERTREPNCARTGWEESSLNKVVMLWSDTRFQRKLRLSRPLFHALVRNLTRSGAIWDNDNKFTPEDQKVPAYFKVAVALYHLAYGGSWEQTADASGLGESTVRKYMDQVTAGINSDAIRPFYMGEKPSPEVTAQVTFEHGLPS